MPRPPHVLVVDDDPALRAILADLLTEEGYLVSTQARMRKSLVDLAVLAPDLLILDYLGSSECSGVELLELVRADAQFRETPVLFCSGAVTQLMEKAEQLAAMKVWVVFKPFDLDELLGAVAMLLRSAGKRPADQ